MESNREYRTANLEGQKLDPGSLVGSSFHTVRGNEGVDWQGVVVAESHPGIYLIERYKWIAGSATHQQLVSIDQMLSTSGVTWRFYDDPEWMRNDYDHYLGPRARASERNGQRESV